MSGLTTDCQASPIGHILLRCTGISKAFSGQRVLDAVDFDVCAGEVHVLAGENGAGKSTLVKILSGVHQPDEGEIVIAEKGRVSFRSVHDAVRAGVAMIHQELSLAPSMSIADNLFLGQERTHRMGWLNRRAQRRAAIAALRQVGLQIDPNRPIGGLPLATRHLIEIAKALLRNARILIMDEPTSALARPDVERLFGLVRSLTTDTVRPAAIIYISHRMEEIYELADRITVLRDGRRVVTAPTGELAREALLHAMVGRMVEEQFDRQTRESGEELLRLDGVSVRDERGWAIRNASVKLHRGEIVGVAGLHGSGAGALLHAIFGNGRMTEGTMFIRGEAVDMTSPRHAMRHGMALLTDDRKTTGLCQGLSMQANVTLPSIESLAPYGWRRVGREFAAANGAIASFGIRCHGPSQIVRTVSGGNQQKIALGKWLLRTPSILLLDDPTRGVDVGARQEIHRLIDQAATAGAGVLMTSSDLQELLALSDRVVVLHRGQITAVLNRREATSQRVMAAAMGEACPEAQKEVR